MGRYNSTTNQYLQLVDQLVDRYNIPNDIIYALLEYVKALYRSDIENKYRAPMFWIGMYIALASLVCILAMVADLIHGFRWRKLWFPSKYFRMNAAFLVIIFVAMKLPVDLSDVAPGDLDQAGKLGSMAFMCTMMANLLPCLATMDSHALLSNIIALCVLVITLVVNICIQIQTGVVSYREDMSVIQIMSPKYDVKPPGISKHWDTILATIYVALLVVLLILHVCSSFAILKAKKIMERRYRQGHHIASKDIQQSPGELLKVEQIQKYVSNHWIMAGSGSPEFVAAFFCTTSASGVICVLVVVLHALNMSWTTKALLEDTNYSDYSWSMIVILIVQSIGVVIGTFAPVSRCFATLSSKVMSFKIIINHFKVFEVESYWTQKLRDWKRASIRLPFRNHKLKVVIENLKRLSLIICIEFQEGVVVVCKIIALIPLSIMMCALGCMKLGQKTDNLERDKDLRPYVLQLEDEMELAERTLEGLSKSVKHLIHKGERSQPNNLMKLVEKSTSGFQGVQKFDNMDHEVPSLLSKEEYQDCWSLPIVTLTTIAFSLPKIEKKEVDGLLQSVREGLAYVRLVEENLNATDHHYVRIQELAETLWQEVDVCHKWLGYKLQDTGFHENRAGQIVEWFSDTAKSIVYSEDISKDNIGRLNDDSIHSSICANSMYRITKTILLTYQTIIDDNVSQKKLFDDLASMISDIMASCLTNLPQVITVKCHTNVVEKREESVKDAAVLLGETTQIIKTLLDRGIPCMNPGDLPFIHKWRACLGDP
ncbi:hypothetical protein SSX86_009884 [Deinandra increscens subsp. villosa]|uniref:Uncharacterized protein n=1 Tax=Deinandra increscens subsp. villosa TaxID=3103831 RepID=A0AAP0DBC3_9ASTR